MRDPGTLTAADLAAMNRVAEEVRTVEGEGGQCGWVAEILSNEYGWAMHGGLYHAPDGHPIGDHVWNVHTPSGTIIDATADQFGEGEQVRVLPPSHPLHARYRQPETEEAEERLLAQARARRDRDGDYWWLPQGSAAPAAVAYEARVARWRAG